MAHWMLLLHFHQDCRWSRSEESGFGKGEGVNIANIMVTFNAGTL